VIAGVLAAVALALGLVTLAMNQTASQASTHVVLPLKARHKTVAKAVAKPAPKAKTKAKVKPKPKPDPNVVAALTAGLPKSIARGLGTAPVAVVQLTSASDTVAGLAAAEAKSGAALAGAAYVAVDVDGDGGAVEQLARALGTLPDAPATLVYQRPAKLVLTLPGFNDRTVVQQAAADAKPLPVAHAVATAARVVPKKPPAPSWSQLANTLCRTTLPRLATLASAKGSSAQLARFKTVSADFVTRFAALRPAAANAAQVTQLDTVLRQQYAAENAMLAAGRAGNSVKVEAESATAAALEQRAHGLETKLGATSCAQGAA
jgi:hypothetical protein